jgi:hypothetical protein
VLVLVAQPLHQHKASLVVLLLEQMATILLVVAVVLVLSA